MVCFIDLGVVGTIHIKLRMHGQVPDLWILITGLIEHHNRQTTQIHRQDGREINHDCHEPPAHIDQNTRHEEIFEDRGELQFFTPYR